VQQGQILVAPRPASADSATREWVVAALIFGLMLIDGVREGGFWHPDAGIAAAGSVVLLVVAAVINPLDRRSRSVVAALVLLASWWGIRAATTGSLGDVLPLGATCLAAAAAFAAVRSLRGADRQVAALGVVWLGAAGSLVGFAGLLWRWFPMAMPAQGLWRLSTTLTYSDAAGLVLGMCLLVALGIDRYPLLARLAVCLCAGGLLASQSRGAYIAFACACAIVPWHRYGRSVVPLASGASLGVVAIGTSPTTGRVWWLGVALVAALCVSAVPPGSVRAMMSDRRLRAAVACLVLGGLLASGFLLHHEIGLRAFAPSDQDRSVEWSAAWHQWTSAPILGVGPDRLLTFQAPDGTFAHFAHNEYLQVAADAGAIGLALLLAVVVTIIRAVRRVDVLTSCACAALVCCAVGGAFDYDWHLTFVGFLGGWCAGLAARADLAETRRRSEEPGESGHRGRNVGGPVRGALPDGGGIS
jgi:O-antigen ligase